MSQEANNKSDQEAKQSPVLKESLPLETLQDVMKDLEQKVNPKSVSEGINILTNINKTNDQSMLLKPMQDGANEFKQRVGRNMTYSEMREMWG
jgi:hypothetical protein